MVIFLKPKSVNALMAHMRDEKNIEIKGSSQKRKLRNMGYFHGYKGYRYCNSPDNKLPYDNFNQIQAVYDFDKNYVCRNGYQKLFPRSDN